MPVASCLLFWNEENGNAVAQTYIVAHLVEHLFWEQKAAGSNPANQFRRILLSVSFPQIRCTVRQDFHRSQMDKASSS